MPKVTKKKSRKTSEPVIGRFSTFIPQGGDSYKSLLYGIATVIVLFILGFSITRLVLHRPQPAIDDRAVSTSTLEEALKNQDESKSGSKSTYKVQEGDTLWSIAEARLGSGFEWHKIADLNKITSPEDLEKGTDLMLPDAASEVATGSESTMQQEKITGTTYVIKPGDNLWDIAVRAYGDGYKWVDIAKANNLSNPSLIHSQNSLKIPRQ